MTAWDQGTAEKMHGQGYTLKEISEACQCSITTAWMKLEAGGKYTGGVVPRGPAFDAYRGRAIIAMRDVMGWSFVDIGALYDYSRQWAHQSYHRAKEVLADEQSAGVADDVDRDIKLAQAEIARLKERDLKLAEDEINRRESRCELKGKS